MTDMESPAQLLRQAVVRLRMYSCDAYLAMEAMAEQLEDVEAVLEKVRHHHPQAVRQAELDVHSARANPVQNGEPMV